MAKSTTFLLPGRVATWAAYWSPTNTCSSSEANCASPKMPRVLTLLSRCFKSPTPWARVCISPRPLCTCSSWSATCLKPAPRRACNVVCSFSSTVARISSSLAALVVCSWASWASKVLRTSARVRALVSLSSAMRRALDSLKPVSWVFSVSDNDFCKPANCRPNASICVFWVRVASALCCVSVC